MLEQAVGAAQNKTLQSETLTVVTADHSHCFTIAGHPTLNNDILGKNVDRVNIYRAFSGIFKRKKC